MEKDYQGGFIFLFDKNNATLIKQSKLMTEDFLHYLWRYQKFNKPITQLATGESLQINQPGYHNHQAGPDFSDARIIIDGQQWAGQVEIHLKSSDWYRHGHQQDLAYDAVILHVVYEHDREVHRSDGSAIPTLSIQGCFDENLYWRYEQLIQNENFIPCEKQLSEVDTFLTEAMLERSIIERMEHKTHDLSQLLEHNKGDWRRTFYQWCWRSFGLTVNAAPMLQLARMVEETTLARHRENEQAVDALFLGSSGLLLASEPQEEYENILRREYQFLKRKYNLRDMQPSVWKYARLRPPGFPDIRIVQAACLFRQEPELFSKVLEGASAKDLETITELHLHPYWQQHYRLGKVSKPHRAAPGRDFWQRWIANAVVPFLFLYGSQKGLEPMRQKALQWLQALPFEKNKITLNFKQLGILPSLDGYYSQSVLHLYKEYCLKKGCLKCLIGNQLLKKMP